MFLNALAPSILKACGSGPICLGGLLVLAKALVARILAPSAAKIYILQLLAVEYPPTPGIRVALKRVSRRWACSEGKAIF